MPMRDTVPTQDIPETQGPDQGQEVNPVIGALKTIQTWIASIKEKDPTKAEQLSQSFQSFIGSLQGGAGAQPPKPNETNPEEGESQNEPMSKEIPVQEPSMKRAPSRPIPMNARKGAVPIM